MDIIDIIYYTLGIQSPCQIMIGMYNHLRNARYLGSMKPFSEGDWIPRHKEIYTTTICHNHQPKGPGFIYHSHLKPPTRKHLTVGSICYFSKGKTENITTSWRKTAFFAARCSECMEYLPILKNVSNQVVVSNMSYFHPGNWGNDPF